MGMEWLANPLGLYGACFTLQDQHFGLVLGLGMRWDTTVLSIVKTDPKFARGCRWTATTHWCLTGNLSSFWARLKSLGTHFGLFFEYPSFLRRLAIMVSFKPPWEQVSWGPKKSPISSTLGDRADKSLFCMLLYDGTPMLVFDPFFGL